MGARSAGSGRSRPGRCARRLVDRDRPARRSTQPVRKRRTPLRGGYFGERSADQHVLTRVDSSKTSSRVWSPHSFALRRVRRSATSPSPRTSRPIRWSETRARAGVWLVSSGGVALRHTREGDEGDIWDGAQVDDLVHFAWSLDERLPRGVGGGLALAANR